MHAWRVLRVAGLVRLGRRGCGQRRRGMREGFSTPRAARRLRATRPSSLASCRGEALLARGEQCRLLGLRSRRRRVLGDDVEPVRDNRESGVEGTSDRGYLAHAGGSVAVPDLAQDRPLDTRADRQVGERHAARVCQLQKVSQWIALHIIRLHVRTPHSQSLCSRRTRDPLYICGGDPAKNSRSPTGFSDRLVETARAATRSRLRRRICGALEGTRKEGRAKETVESLCPLAFCCNRSVFRRSRSCDQRFLQAPTPGFRSTQRERGLGDGSGSVEA